MRIGIVVAKLLRTEGLAILAFDDVCPLVHVRGELPQRGELQALGILKPMTREQLPICSQQVLQRNGLVGGLRTQQAIDQQPALQSDSLAAVDDLRIAGRLIMMPTVFAVIGLPRRVVRQLARRRGVRYLLQETVHPLGLARFRRELCRVHVVGFEDRKIALLGDERTGCHGFGDQLDDDRLVRHFEALGALLVLRPAQSHGDQLAQIIGKQPHPNVEPAYRELKRDGVSARLQQFAPSPVKIIPARQCRRFRPGPSVRNGDRDMRLAFGQVADGDASATPYALEQGVAGFRQLIHLLEHLSYRLRVLRHHAVAGGVLGERRCRHGSQKHMQLLAGHRVFQALDFVLHAAQNGEGLFGVLGIEGGQWAFFAAFSALLIVQAFDLIEDHGGDLRK